MPDSPGVISLNGPILFLQKAEVLDEQRAPVTRKIRSVFPDADVQFAGTAEEVPAGNFPIVITPTLPWLPQALERIEGCRWIHFLSAGVEKIWDMPFDKSRLLLTKSSGIHGNQMSEYAIGAMLHFAKGFDRFVEQSRNTQWSRFWLDELTGRTVMVLGAGHIGGAVAARARAFGMRTIGVQRRPVADSGFDLSIGMEALRAHLPEVDYLVVSLPLTPATAGCVDQEMLMSLRPGAVLVDISRGGVVRESAVLAALECGQLRGAALDVFEQQPLPPESGLWGRRDVLLTPHVSGTSPHYLERALDSFIANAQNLARGESPVTPVDIGARY